MNSEMCFRHGVFLAGLELAAKHQKWRTPLAQNFRFNFRANRARPAQMVKNMA
jgi:hypothetical protein